MSKFPRSSPWGAVQHCEVMAKGVFMVNTPSHTGIMVRKNAVECLTKDALKYGISAKNYICFEGHNTQIVIRELLDKKLWQIPNRIADKTQYEDSVNNTLRELLPEYWEARQKSLSEEKKPKLSERLDAGKAKAAAHNASTKTPDTTRKSKNETEH